MINEDNTGFINFPFTDKKLVTIDTGSTLVYIVVFDPNKESNLENINLFLPGIFVSDDVVSRPLVDKEFFDLENLIEDNTEQNNYDAMYFPNIVSDEFWKRQMSINFISTVCVGWSNQTYEYRNEIKFWNASFKDLTNEGRNLYYGLKKLHNNKEVRILTFNTN